MASRAYYTPIEGSRELVTARLQGDAALAEIESLQPGDLRRYSFAGEWLGAAVIRDRFVPVPRDAFDRVAARLNAEEQATYFHLLRLSYGAGRNFCRVGKRDLMARLAVSERHLNRLLDGLVRRRAVRAVHRNNLGTLYRVQLPAEMLGESLGPEVVQGRATRVRPHPRQGRTSSAPAAQPYPAAASPQPSPPRHGELGPSGAATDVGGGGAPAAHPMASHRGVFGRGAAIARIPARVKRIRPQQGLAVRAIPRPADDDGAP